MTGTRRRLPLAAAALLVPALARAHLVNTGLGPFYDGVSHLALTPEDLLVAVALALLAGFGGAAAGRSALLAMPAAWLAGGLLGLAWPGAPSMAPLSWLSIVVAGLLVAAGARLPPPMAAVLVAAFGLVHGVPNGAAMSQTRAGALGLAGVVALLFVVVALCAAAAVGAREGWRRVAVRVAGSWIAAVGLLALGWTLRAARG